MIAIRRARPADATGIGMVHVASWRSAYPGVLPDDFLANLSPARQSTYYERAIRAESGVNVAVASGSDALPHAIPHIVGFSTARRARQLQLGDGEIETLYVLDDWKDRGLGRRLFRASAQYLALLGCRSLFLWVLADNPARWFYEHLGGKRVAIGSVSVAGTDLAQIAFAWDRVEAVLEG